MSIPPRKVIFLDTETTGLHPDNHAEMVELGAYVVIERPFGGWELCDMFRYRLRPEKTISLNPSELRQALAVNGFTLDQITKWPKREEAYHAIANFLLSHAEPNDHDRRLILAGHHIDFDYRFLNALYLEFDDDRAHTLFRALTIGAEMYDTAHLAMALHDSHEVPFWLPHRAGKDNEGVLDTSLTTILSALGDQSPRRHAHTALGDAARAFKAWRLLKAHQVHAIPAHLCRPGDVTTSFNQQGSPLHRYKPEPPQAQPELLIPA